MRMLSTKINRNNCAVTEAFIDAIIADEAKYICIPLCADTRKLKNGDHKHLGHMLDKQTGTFLTEQIGAFSRFEKVQDEYGISLVGEARIAKRNKKVCSAILDLYKAGNLNFSFEILAQRVETTNGVTIIDAAEGNELIGMAVVSIPAYPEAVALALVAEIENENRQRCMLKQARLEISEVDFETIRCWFFKAMRALLGDEIWDYRIERIGVDFAILYGVRNGRTLKIEFVAGDGGLTMTDAYEVIYQRIDNNGGYEMSETTNKDLENKVAEAQAQATEAKAKVATLEAAGRQKDERIAELEQQVAALQEHADQLAPLQSEVDALRSQIAEVEAEATRNELRQFANAHSLDLEDAKIAKAIADMDHKTLMAESANAVVHLAKPVVAPHAFSAGLQTDPYGGLLGSEKE